MSSKNTMPCSNCQKLIKRHDSELKKSKTGNMFCSRSCSATFNNRKFPKRKLEKTCKQCSEKISSNTSYCLQCYSETLMESKTYQEIRSIHPYQKNSSIRGHARKKYLKSNKQKSCFVCGYSKHFDVCHVKEISSFSDDDLIKNINDIENLIALCKNHHWEFDHNCLDPKDLNKLNITLVAPRGIEPRIKI